MMNKEWKILQEKVVNSKRIFLSTHANPDGDGLGSEVAFYYYLKTLNKDCKIINISPIQDNYQFLNKDNMIEVYNKSKHDSWIETADLCVVFDIGDFRRLGEISSLIDSYDIESITIDHHPNNSSFFSFDIVDTLSPATGYMVWKYFEYIQFDNMCIDSANALYCALITDTGSFRYNGTTPDCHKMAAHLLEIGVKPYEIYALIYEQRTKEQVLLLAETLNNIQYSECGEFAWVGISDDIFNKTNTKPSHVEGFADFIRGIQNVEVSFVMLELKSSKIRVSFRSRGKYIINDIAKKFGGGGHKLAAGATVENTSLANLASQLVIELERKK